MKKDITKKIDGFLEEEVRVNTYLNPEELYKDHRPIQFMRWWGNYRPGDRINVNFFDDSIELFGTNSEGQFAGSKYSKELVIDDPDAMEEFKSAEGYIWDFC
jgi:hypothetical protein